MKFAFIVAVLAAATLPAHAAKVVVGDTGGPQAATGRTLAVFKERAEKYSKSWYATIARNVAAFPVEDLKWTEPPLRSIPGPVV